MNISEIKERFECARNAMALNHARMREDLAFSNPASPQQWPEKMLSRRKNRISLVFDQTNQFINQVVNSYRQNRPQASAIPANSMADKATAEALTGMLRHIDYVSRADIAWDWAVQCAANVGIGWVRVYPKLVDEEYNTQEITISRVIDPLSCFLDEGSMEPDGSDATSGYLLSLMSTQAFKKKYPKERVQSWDDANATELVTICESFVKEFTKQNRLVIQDPDGVESTVSEDEYWAIAKQWGFKPLVLKQWVASIGEIKWRKLSGADIVEETTFPSSWVPLVPVIGNETFIEGERILCGMTRRMMDSQRAYNYSRTADIETGALQPKSPFVGPQEAFDGYEEYWKNANEDTRSYLPYNGFTEINGVQTPIQPPQRQSPPAIGAGFGNLTMQAFSDLQASVGMYRENLGAQTNANSGIAIQSRQKQGDTATFHYIDNAARSKEHMARIELSMIPALYDTKRQARIIGQDGQSSMVTIDPEGKTQKKGKVATVINPTVGTYDVQIKVGPSYGTLREETVEQITRVIQSAPETAPALLPMWAKMQDWPDSDKVAKLLLAMAPPQVQQVESEDSDIPPAIQAQVMRLQQENQQMKQMLEQASKQLEDAELEKEARIREIDIKQQEADTKREQVMINAQKAQGDLSLREAEFEAQYAPTDLSNLLINGSL